MTRPSAARAAAREDFDRAAGRAGVGVKRVDYPGLLARKGRRSKYGAVRTTIDGITFASKAEARRYRELRLLEQAGEIVLLTVQPKFPLVVDGVKVCDYVADFRYSTPNAEVVVEDVKGVRTPVYRLKAKLMKALYGITIREVTQ
jgi:hypothetical protein